MKIADLTLRQYKPYPIIPSPLYTEMVVKVAPGSQSGFATFPTTLNGTNVFTQFIQSVIFSIWGAAVLPPGNSYTQVTEQLTDAGTGQDYFQITLTANAETPFVQDFYDAVQYSVSINNGLKELTDFSATELAQLPDYFIRIPSPFFLLRVASGVDQFNAQTFRSASVFDGGNFDRLMYSSILVGENQDRVFLINTEASLDSSKAFDEGVYPVHPDDGTAWFTVYEFTDFAQR